MKLAGGWLGGCKWMGGWESGWIDETGRWVVGWMEVDG